MTTNYQLENFLQTEKAKGFSGVYGSDEIWRTYKKNSCIIVNYSPIGSKGSHWIGIRNINSKSPIEYFDSYGYRPDFDDKILGLKTRFREFLEKYNTSGYPMVYNNFDLQAFGSDVCGEYCCKFILDGLPYIGGKKNDLWLNILKYNTPEGRDDAIQEDIKIRRKNKGYIGGEIDKANAFFTNLDPLIQSNFVNDNSGILTFYYASLPYTQTNTTKRNVEMFKNININDVGSGLDDFYNKSFKEKMKKVDNWKPDKAYKIEQIIRVLNRNNNFHKYLLDNCEDLGKLYNNLCSNPYPWRTYNNFNIQKEYDDYFVNFLHHFRQNNTF